MHPALSFFHEFNPPTQTAQQRVHKRGGGTYLPAATARAKALLQAVMERYAPPVEMPKPLLVAMFWTWPGADEPILKTTVPDADNVTKMALDAMTHAGFWGDDAHVSVLLVAKFQGPITGLHVTVRTVGMDDLARIMGAIANA